MNPFYGFVLSLTQSREEGGMATFLLNSTSGGEVIAARITPRAGANPFAIDGCGRNCSFMYEAPELKKVSERAEL